MFAFAWGKGELAKWDGPDVWQKEFLTSIRDQLVEGHKTDLQPILEAASSGHGTGKGGRKQDLIHTPAGLTRWGDLKTEDFVFGLDGKPTRVLATHELGLRQVFKVSLDDGSSTVVTEDHVWRVRGRQERRNKKATWRDLTTRQLLDAGVQRSNGTARAKQWELPKIGSVDFPARAVEIDPYTLGVWIGNGGRNSGNISTMDAEVIAKLASANSIHVGKTISKAFAVGVHKLAAKLRRTGVLDKYSYQKSVPVAYMENSVEVRSEVLRGLLDTDGECSPTGCVIYSSTSHALAEDIVWLARSLGGKAQFQPTVKDPFYRDEDGIKVQGRPCWRVTLAMPSGFRCFYTERKQGRVKINIEDRYRTRWIDSITPAGEADCMCITVENPDGMYLTNDFIPTHNSVLVSWLILWALLTSDHVRGVVTANTDVQLRTKTWAELSKWFRLCFGADTILDMTATAIFSKNPKHEKTHRIDAIPWSLNRPEAVAGLHNSGKRLLIIFDESSAIPDIIWETQMGALTDKDTEIIWCVFGNPTRSDGSFHKCFQSGSRWSTRRVDSRSARASNKTELQFWIEAYGLDSDFVRMRVLGLPPRIADASFISSDVVEFAMKREISESATMHYPLVFGVDVARFGCHDDQTEVLTDSGWKLFSQLTGEERVFSRHSDGVADWQPITCVHRYRHSGSMVAYENERVNFCLTENHRMLSASVGSRRKARQIEPPNYVLKEWTSCSGSFISPRQVEWVGVRPAPFVFTDRRDMPYGGTRPGQTWKFAPEDWFSFLGWFISEGNVYYEKRVGGRHRVLIAQTNREKRVQIESLFSRMGIKYRITPTGNQIEFSIRAIADHLDSECGRGAPFKRIPGYVLNATPDLIEKFLDAYCDGDGSRRAGRRQVYATTSVKIADAIQELLVKLGRAGKISTAVKAGSTSKIHGRTITRQHDVHVVTELKNSRPLEIEKKKTKLITYDGWVHCVSTPHKTLLTRRKGCVLWSGNSDKSVVTARRGPKQVLLKKFRGLDTMQLASTVVDYWRTMGQNGSICVDGIGIGAGVVDRLRQLKLPVVDVNVAHEATKPREFGNVRSELYGIMKDWLPGASLINDEEQRLALIALQYGYNARMQLMMEKKDDLRRRGLPSPDEADALALTFAGETAVLGVRSAKVIPITQQKRIM